jgi:signal transduction histidine kinase
MFLWIRDQKWLPTIYLSLIAFVVFGALDWYFQGPTTILSSAVLALTVTFSRALPWVSIGLSAVGTLMPQYLGLQPQFSMLLATFNLLLMAAFATKSQRRVAYAVNVLVGSSASIWFIISLPVGSAIYGFQLPTAQAKFAVFLAGFIAMIATNANAWFFGRLFITRVTHVGTDFDRTILETELTSTQLALAEQDRRFEIARDVNDLLLEQVSATLATTEAGVYSAKTDATVAPRILERVLAGMRQTHSEIRRLSDLLGLQQEKSFALPGLRDLPKLLVAFRESGYGVNYRLLGEQLSLDGGAELVLYRIVSESLENVRQHAPETTEIDVDFIWAGPALQVVVKDNGEETQNRIAKELNGYTEADDRKALVERPTGASLNVLKERVGLYEGNIEFAKVPGVGFTVSAAFPNIAKYRRAAN